MRDDRPNEPAVTELPTLDAAAPRTEPAPRALPEEIGGFRILGVLGEGGMGIVYEAEQPTPRRRVALKVVRGGRYVDDLYLGLFRREAETLARLVHPNIAALYQAGRTADGQHFFTMELVSGRMLGAFVRERLGGDRPTRAQMRERLRLFATIGRAVNYAHQRGVIHRDLKPTNVVVNEAGEVKILDFGLARITDTDVAATMQSDVGTIKGTLPYMSPEQARGDSGDIDLRTDVYSLGVILYELVAGRPPYETSGLSVVRAIRAICEEAPRPLATGAGGAAIDADLRTIVAKALEKGPERRYQSAGALADDVERLLAGLPILAHPPSTMYQLRKMVARHRGRFAALGAIAVLLVALMATIVVQSSRVRQQRDRATAEAAKAEAIDRFLLDALGGADPWARGSRTVSLLDALHQAQAKAHEAFRTQPLVEASVLQTLGTTFTGLAEYAEADTALRASLALRQRAAGPRSAESADAMLSLSNLYNQWERWSEGEAWARRALAIEREVHGPASLETAVAMNALATALGKEARRREAKALAGEALRIARAAPATGTAGVDAIDVQNNALSVLGEIALGEGDGKTMETVDRERLALLRSRVPGDDIETSQALNDVATAQMMNGDLPGAEKTYGEALRMQRALLGDDHPMVAACRENLGNVYFREGRLDLTARNLELVLAMRRRALGDESEPVARTLANMGTVYRKSGRYADAERAYREAIPRLSRRLGPGHPDVGYTMAGLGDALWREGRFAEGEVSLRRGLAILEKASGEGNALTQRAIGMLADLYRAWRKPAEAARYAARLAAQK